MLHSSLILYIFISFSMPQSLIEAYIEEAKTLPAVIVLRGIAPTLTLKQFLMKKLFPLLNEANNKAVHIEIDPLLFERFDVKAVPTFVCTSKPNPDWATEKTHSAPWVKLSGAVTAQWAWEKLTPSIRK